MKKSTALILFVLFSMTLVILALINSNESTAKAPKAPSLSFTSTGNYDSPVFLENFKNQNFIVTRDGIIYRKKDGKQNKFLDISNTIKSGGEQGLLSMAVSPNFAKNKTFFIYYTKKNDSLQIDRYRSGVKAFPKSKTPVLNIPHPGATNHNGGLLEFYGQHLFIATGDGGGGGDPNENAQNKSSLLGKMLRIKPNYSQITKTHPYSIPSSNPYVGKQGRDEIYSIGLRNPWRYSFYQNKLIIADVGQSQYEEINYLSVQEARGANFGWDCREGNHDYETEGCEGKKFVDPIYEYTHDRGCSITGGYVVENNNYVYADFCEGELRSLNLNTREDTLLDIQVSNPVSFSKDSCGRLYVLSLGGNILRQQKRC